MPRSLFFVFIFGLTLYILNDLFLKVNVMHIEARV